MISFENVTLQPYEALYGRPCRSPVCWTKVGERPSTGPDLVKNTSEKVHLIQSVFSRLRADRRAMSIDGDDL